MNCPTVKIKHESLGHVVINESDFDSRTMELFVEGEQVGDSSDASTTPFKCKAMKGDGSRCNNDAVKDSEYCHIKAHKPKD
jgi:hypothetical protein